MTSLVVRSRAEEQMDAVDLDPRTYGVVLKDLSRLNRWTMAARPTLSFLKRAVGYSTFRLLDVGFGYGDMLREIARWARRQGVTAELVGVDLNERSVGIARAATPRDLAIDYREGDYRDLGQDFDFVISSLVTHHMTDDQLASFIEFMEKNARRGWLISDLHRHRFSYVAFPLFARLMRVHRIVREDGQLSIARSFRPAEWRAILANAGISLEQVRIIRCFPFRICVERLR
jgi:2-polyprenyl-3-methyl-5-hydroxy-6-metoxy-1,4-benzoquinol methylase